ncbi:hypothetical protein J2X77_001737 [Sphingobacterium sp. 2149]|nr:hypothetical protein [Sphingobacterium sp. 2149]
MLLYLLVNGQLENNINVGNLFYSFSFEDNLIFMFTVSKIKHRIWIFLFIK